MATTLGLVAAGVPVAPAASAAATGGVISSAGPLTQIQTTADLNCAVNHAGDTLPEFFSTTACGTLVAINGTLYGPANIPAGSGAGPRTPWTPQSQSSSGAGTTTDPYRIVTVVTGGPLQVTQTDTYVTGQESYGTRISVANTGPAAAAVTVYRAGDCYLQNSDVGYGASDRVAGSVACTTGTAPGARIEQWAPLTPGSHFYESGYSSVWNRIGAQLPFPDTSDDAISQDNGAGLSWTSTLPAGATAAFAHLTAFSPTGSTQVSDTDGDSFPDSWESPSGGVDTNGDGTPDLKLSDYGATPDHPDVFVQVNWTQTRSCTLLIFNCSTTNRRPSLAALRDVQNAYLAHGMRLHIDAGPDSVMNPVTGEKWGSRSQVHAAVTAPARIAGASPDDFNWATSYDGIRHQVLSSERSPIFHLALYVGSFDDAGHSGLSRTGHAGGFASPDFMLAHDVINGGKPTRQQEAGTFMHELGHNMGLSHGGSAADAAVNYKPNFPSVMNYFWQFSGVAKNDSLGLLDYSEGTLAPISEGALSESAALEPDSAAVNIATKYFCPNRQVTGPVPSVSNVDWNCSNGSIDAGVVAADVNRSGDTTETFTDHNDWPALVFDGGGSLGGAGDPTAVAPVTPANSEPTADQLAEVATDLKAVGVSAPGQLVMRTATAAPVQLQITNNRSGPVTYNLVQHASGVTLTGVPPTVNLAAGASATITATLSAGPVSNDAYFELDADVAGDPSNTGSAATEVFVVDQPVPDQPPVAGAAIDHISVTPASASTTAGTPVAFTVTAYDADGHVLATPPGTTLAIGPDGSCTAVSCTATVAGPHTVTATAGTKTAQATLTVTAAPTVPAAPIGLTAAPGNGSATLTFTPGSDGGAPASFESSTRPAGVQYSTTDGTTWQALPTTGPDAGGKLTGTVAGLTNGTAYTVAVRAVNIVGAGAPSASTTVTPATTPAPPTGLTATPGNDTATLTFKPGSDGGAPASFQYSTDGTAWQALRTTGPDADGKLTGTVSGLTNGTPYTVRVRATNRVGPGSAASVAVTPAPAVVLTPIQAKYAALGGPTSFLGAPVGPEFDTPGGRAQRYEHGHIYWSAGTGAHEVHGTILEKFVGFGGVPSFLGYPVTDETGLPGGAVSAFTGGSVYWSPSTGAFEVHGLIGVHYRDLGGPAGLGYPVTDETTTPDGAGRYNHFTGGSIYWTPATGAHEVHGAIRARWAALGWEQGLAGYPVTDETDVPGVPGARMSVFAGTNAAIYWSPATGAHEVYGSIRAFYTDRAGGPAGRLGLPTSGEYATQSGRASNFTHGRLDWNAGTGAVTG